MQGDNKPANLTPIKFANYIYMGVAFGYFIYTLITQTGLCGYIEDVQNEPPDVIVWGFSGCSRGMAPRVQGFQAVAYRTENPRLSAFAMTMVNLSLHRPP